MRPLRIAIAGLVLIAVGAAIVAAVPGMRSKLQGKARYQEKLVAMADAAQEVELEWTYQGVAVKSEWMNRVSYQEWVSRMPVKRGEMKGIRDKCHMPHHRIVLESAAGRQEIEVCFSCDSMRIEGDTVRVLPPEWRGPMIELFGYVGIPPEPPGDAEVMKNIGRMPGHVQEGFRRDEAKGRLEKLLAMEEYEGSVYALARVSGVDYRALLGNTMRSKHPGDLHALLEAEAKAGLMVGEPGETHCEALLLLMLSWGDSAFAAALREVPREVQKAVVGNIEHAWSEPGWDLYPETGGMR